MYYIAKWSYEQKHLVQRRKDFVRQSFFAVFEKRRIFMTMPQATAPPPTSPGPNCTIICRALENILGAL
jgi:hypothetical protein